MKPLLSILVLTVGFTACGGGASSSSSVSGTKSGSPSAQSYVISTVAGGGPNNVPAVNASMDPFGVASDSVGNVYIASTSFAPPRVFKVDVNGTLTVVAGNGFTGYSGDGGPGAQAGLVDPFSVAVDSSGNIYIADYLNNRIREVVATTGNIQTVAGTGKQGYSGDGGKATQAQLYGPTAVAVDSSGNIFITDSNNYVIREVTAATGIIKTVAGNGGRGYSGDGGKATQATLDFPTSACVDNSGNIFIVEPVGPRIREVLAATGIIQTVAGNGMIGYSGDGGPATQAELAEPKGVSVDSFGNIFIADTVNQRIREVIAATGIIQTVAGGGTSDPDNGGLATQAHLGTPNGVALDSAGNIFISDDGYNQILEVVATTGDIHAFAGDGTLYGGSGNGIPATDAGLAVPQALALDGSGNVLIGDAGEIREVVAATGIIQTVSAMQAAFAGGPGGLAVDNSGNVFISDTGNFIVREFVAATGVIKTVAGNGTSGYSGDGGPATQAQLGWPAGLFVDSSGNVFIADSYFQTCNIDPDGNPICMPGGGGTIRRVDAKTGIIHTVAGNGTLGDSGDGGPATQAEMEPNAVFVDGSGNIFISDGADIREVIATTGIIQTVAGKGISGYSGDGGKATQAELSGTDGVWLDKSGNIFIADSANHRIREVVAATGIIQTVAGNGTAGYSGDGGPATQAELASPGQLVLDSAGDVFFIDPLSRRVRKLTPGTP
jgi:sugar lactone lactonase YvrE